MRLSLRAPPLKITVLIVDAVILYASEALSRTKLGHASIGEASVAAHMKHSGISFTAPLFWGLVVGTERT